MLYAVRCLKSNEDMILALAGQFKQLSHEPEKFRWLNGIRTHDPWGHDREPMTHDHEVNNIEISSLQTRNFEFRKAKFAWKQNFVFLNSKFRVCKLKFSSFEFVKSKQGTNYETARPLRAAVVNEFDARKKKIVWNLTVQFFSCNRGNGQIPHPREGLTTEIPHSPDT